MANMSNETIMTIELHTTRPDTEPLLRTMLADSLAISAWHLEGTTLTVYLHSEEGEEHLARAFLAAGLHPLSTRSHQILDTGDPRAC